MVNGFGMKKIFYLILLFLSVFFQHVFSMEYDMLSDGFVSDIDTDFEREFSGLEDLFETDEKDFLISEILKIKNNPKLLRTQKGLLVHNGLLIKLYELLHGDITKESSIQAKKFWIYLNDNKYFYFKDERETKNAYLRLRELLLRFKRLSESEKVNRMADIEAHLNGLRPLSAKEQKIINRIFRLKYDDLLTENARVVLNRLLFVLLYELRNGVISKDTQIKTRDFLDYAKEHDIICISDNSPDKKEYNNLRAFFNKFKKYPESTKVKKRVEAQRYLTSKNKLSAEEKLIVFRILELQKRRLKSGSTRSNIEVGLIVRLYELFYCDITEQITLKAKQFLRLLNKVGIDITLENLNEILSYFKKLPEDKKIEKRKSVDKYLFNLENKTILNVPIEYIQSIISNILSLQEKRLNHKRRQRGKIELGLIIRLYEIQHGNITQETEFGRVRYEEFIDYLNNSSINIKYNLLKTVLLIFKKLPEEKKNLRRIKVDKYLSQKQDIKKISNKELRILNEILRIEKDIAENKLHGRKWQNIRNGILIKLRELIFGPIKIDTDLNINEFVDFLLDNNYINDKSKVEYKKIYGWLRGVFLRFKKLPEEKKEKKRAEVDKYLKKIRE